MGTKKQEELKKVIFQKTKSTRTLSDVNPDISLKRLKKLGLKFKFDNSKDYYRKTTSEVKLLKEQQEKESINEETITIKGQKFVVGPNAIVDQKGNTYGWSFIKVFYEYGKKKGYIK